MNDQDSASTFQQRIYRDLDKKLRSSDWDSGASEAHGILCGLACRGIKEAGMDSMIYLFQTNDRTQREILTGLFGLILRDLSSEEFSFKLLLPDDQSPVERRIEELANWCQGFLQGLCHDGTAVTESDCQTESVSEIVKDVLEITHIDIYQVPESKERSEKYLFEIEEYLRVSVQIVYDELNLAPPLH